MYFLKLSYRNCNKILKPGDKNKFIAGRLLFNKKEKPLIKKYI